MSKAIMFDTFKYVKDLKSVGFSEEQAEVHAEALHEVIDERLATKQDLHELKLATKQDLRELKCELHAFKQEVDVKLSQLENKLTVRMGSMIFATIVILGTVGFFNHYQTMETLNNMQQFMWNAAIDKRG